MAALLRSASASLRRSALRAFASSARPASSVDSATRLVGDGSLSHVVGPSTPALDTTILVGGLLERTARAHADRLGVAAPAQGVRWTWAELDARVNVAAAGLSSLGIGKGDRVGTWLPNIYEYIVLQYATARVGSIMVTLNPAYRAPELAHALELSGCKAMVMVPSVAQSNYVDMLNSGAALDPARLPLLKHVIVAGSGVAGEGGGREGAEERSGSGSELDECAVRAAVASLAAGAGASSQHRFHAYADVFENTAHASSSASSAASLADHDLAPTDPINIQFTSGTTGLPKAVLLTHLNIANNGIFVAARQRLTAEDRVCIPVPM